MILWGSNYCFEKGLSKGVGSQELYRIMYTFHGFVVISGFHSASYRGPIGLRALFL